MAGNAPTPAFAPAAVPASGLLLLVFSCSSSSALLVSYSAMLCCSPAPASAPTPAHAHAPAPAPAPTSAPASAPASAPLLLLLLLLVLLGKGFCNFGVVEASGEVLSIIFCVRASENFRSTRPYPGEQPPTNPRNSRTDDR